MHYKLFVPQQAVGANLVYFDLFNAAYSGATIEVLSLVPVVSGSTAVSGLLGVDLFLTRTTAVGTGGTAATRNGTSLTACTISGVDNSQELMPTITARLTPSGGATAGAVLGWRAVFTEEANAGTYIQEDFVAGGPPVMVEAGSGIRVVQGSVASVGNIGFDVLFRVRAK